MDDRNWRFDLGMNTSRSRYGVPQPLRDGQHILTAGGIQTAKIGSLVDVTESADPEGLRVFYYLVQDLKALTFSLISLHFKVFLHIPSLAPIPTDHFADQAYLNRRYTKIGLGVMT